MKNNNPGQVQQIV